LLVWSFKLQFKELLDWPRTKLININKLIQQLKENQKFQRVLECILGLGNHLNGSTNKGEAYGFRMSDLEALSNLKSNDLNQSSFLMYITKFVKQHFPDAHSWTSDVNLLFEANGAKKSFTNTPTDIMNDIDKDIKSSEEELERVNKICAIYSNLQRNHGEPWWYKNLTAEQKNEIKNLVQENAEHDDLIEIVKNQMKTMDLITLSDLKIKNFLTWILEKEDEDKFLHVISAWELDAKLDIEDLREYYKKTEVLIAETRKCFGMGIAKASAWELLGTPFYNFAMQWDKAVQEVDTLAQAEATRQKKRAMLEKEREKKQKVYKRDTAKCSYECKKK